MFVDREEELGLLERAMKARFSGGDIHLLLYGMRRVGKSRLVDEFLKGKRGFRLDCGSFSRGADFFRGIFMKLASLEGLGPTFGPDEIDVKCLRVRYGLFERPLDDDIFMIKEGIKLASEYAEERGNLIVALDEFHVLVETVSTYSRTEPYEVMREKILWAIRDEISRSSNKVFWILITSASFLLSEYEKADRAFLEVFQKLEIKPLSEKASRELTKKLLRLSGIWFDESVIEKIASLSGGIPALIEKLCFYVIKFGCEDADCLCKAVINGLEAGDFDDFFDSYLDFISDYLRWGKPTITKVLRALAEGLRSPKEIASKTGLKPQTISNILVDLRKKGIITPDGEICYPLLKEWLLARDIPPSGAPRRDLIMYSLGIALESYVRELLSQVRKKVRIEGEELFLGTTEFLEIGPLTKVLRHKELDAVALETSGRKLCFEVKVGKVARKDVIKFHERAKSEGCDLMIIIAKDAEPPALVEIGKRGIILLTHNGLKELARALDFPKLLV